MFLLDCSYFSSFCRETDSNFQICFVLFSIFEMFLYVSHSLLIQNALIWAHGFKSVKEILFIKFWLKQRHVEIGFCRRCFLQQVTSSSIKILLAFLSSLVLLLTALSHFLQLFPLFAQLGAWKLAMERLEHIFAHYMPFMACFLLILYLGLKKKKKDRKITTDI